MGDLNSSNFYEGAEKLMEVWFTVSCISSKTPDLKIIDRSCWEQILDIVKCEIIHEKSDENIKTFILSESSLFVTSNRFILKTCGTTNLLHALEPLLELVKEQCGFDVVDDFFYSHKKFERPDLQNPTHQSFDNEVAFLDSIFKNGAAYVLGRINRDCWYFYTIDKIGVTQPDQTLELIMKDLDVTKMAVFRSDTASDARDATEISGIANLFPEMVIDDYLFSPCGYSMNAILPKGKYFTIHITPEPEFSYVSFETDVSVEDYLPLMKKVIEIFNPEKVMLTVCTNQESLCTKTKKIYLDDFNQLDTQVYDLKNYNILYSYYVKKPI